MFSDETWARIVRQGTWQDEYVISAASVSATNPPADRALVEIKLPVPMTIAVKLDGPVDPTGAARPAWFVSSDEGDRMRYENGVWTIITSNLRVDTDVDSWVVGALVGAGLTEARWIATAGIGLSAPSTP
jgi:hypothetical protein